MLLSSSRQQALGRGTGPLKHKTVAEAQGRQERSETSQVRQFTGCIYQMYTTSSGQRKQRRYRRYSLSWNFSLPRAVQRYVDP